MASCSSLVTSLGTARRGRPWSIPNPGRSLPMVHSGMGMATLSDQVRDYVYRNYIVPARENKTPSVTVTAGDVHQALSPGAAEHGVLEPGTATVHLIAIGTETVIGMETGIGTATGIVTEMTIVMDIMTTGGIAGGTSTITTVRSMTKITTMTAKSK